MAADSKQANPVSPIPTSVRLTIAALIVLIALNLVGAIGAVVNPRVLIPVGISLALQLLILWGLIVGHRLAWQWGRILGLLAALLFTFSAIVMFSQSSASPAPLVLILTGITLVVQALCLYTIFFSLGRPSAREHFRLRCPSCGKLTSSAADFFFNRAKCKACQNVW